MRDKRRQTKRQYGDVVLFAVPSYGQQKKKNSALEERVAALEETVAALEKKTRTLEMAMIPLLRGVAAERRNPPDVQLGDRFRQAEQPRPAPRGNGAVFNQFDELDGKAFIVAGDGEFLGTVSSAKFDDKSIMNSFGDHGSKFADKSIFNTFGDYGSNFSNSSAWSKFATEPPMVFLGEKFIGYLTVSEQKTPRIDPNALVGYLRSKR